MVLLRILRRILMKFRSYPKTVIRVVKRDAELSAELKAQFATYAADHTQRVYEEKDCMDFLERHYGMHYRFKFARLRYWPHKVRFFVYAYIYKMGGIYLSTNLQMVRPLKDVFEDTERCYMLKPNLQNKYESTDEILCSPPGNLFINMLLTDLYNDDKLELSEADIDGPNGRVYEVLRLLTDRPIVSDLNRLHGVPSVHLFFKEGDFGNKIKDFRGRVIFEVQTPYIYPKALKLPAQELNSKDFVITDSKPWLNHSKETRMDMPMDMVGNKPKEVVVELCAYSRFGQEVWVLQLCNFKRDGYFVDIGCGNPKVHNNTFLLEEAFAWKGLCVDPLGRNMKLRKCEYHRGLVYHTDAEVEFVEEAEENSGIVGYGPPKKGPSVFKEAKCTESVLKMHAVPPQVDYLSVSVQGAELSVLRGIDFENRIFKMITVEDGNEESRRYDICSFMRARGYEMRQNFSTCLGFVYARI